ncbi:CfaE/CblD family pilus tip adhesin [Chimaeribacter arupi]|uniref:CfaE/CblD family pilus tip adhesin n=1 Tax=Chimaeribacter arupi TaxID=2060066 RepID=UPI000C7A5419|nr:CfaE/CblD family pilus tip adhesin [Chimaeribacter arupi]PLR31625.1 CblD like pilus biogenesis initiator [Chimaeribacter arupi]
MKLFISGFFLWAVSLWGHAESSPPTSSALTIQRTFDRLSPPTEDISLWKQVLGGYDTEDPGKWNSNGWVCESNSDPAHGQCSPKLVWYASGETVLPLRFTEKRSGMRQVLNLRGYIQPYFVHTGCGTYGSKFQVYGAAAVGCQSGGGSSGAALTVWLPAAELARLPVGGLWQADLRLKLTNYFTDGRLADFTAHFQFDVVDPDHIEIFFPAFRTASPLVELDLRPQGAPDGSPTAQDITPLDMCLYDGYNANSTRYDVLLRDEGRPHNGRADSDFSIYREAAESDPDSPRDRIDYQVRLKNPESGELMPVVNNAQITWWEINKNLIRPVRLPSINYPVLCVPAPLLLVVPKFAVKDKNAGHYRGKMTVVFTPTTPTVN